METSALHTEFPMHI